MRRHPDDASGHRPTITRWIALSAAVLTALAGVAFAPTAASAAEIDPVTDISITNPPPLHNGTPYTFRAQFSLPDSATAGDTFTIGFPQAVTGYADSFPLIDDEGGTVGTCVVDSDSFVCTLSDYADTHVNITGWVDFVAQFTQEVTEDSVDFESENGVIYSVPVPGGIVIPDRPLPTDVQKFGYMRADGDHVEWQIVLPGDLLAVSDEAVVVTDRLDPALTIDPGTDIHVAWISASDWPDMDLVHHLGQGAAPGTFSVSDPVDNAFDVTIHGPVTDGSRIYIVFVTAALPADVQDGDVFENTATGTGFDVTAEPVVFVDSDGGAQSDGLGDFALTKSVTGTGAGVVGGQDFTVEYSYVRDGETIAGELVVADGETAGLAEIPEGTVVSLSEVTPAAPGVTFATPVFSGTGVTDNGDGSATITIGDDDTVAVGLENPATRNLGGLELTKSVTGLGEGFVGDQDFTVAYAYRLDGETIAGELVVADGETAALAGIPEGTVVSLSEIVPTVPGVAFGTPVFSGTGVTDNGDGTATVAIATGAPIAVGLENPTVPVPPVPPVPPTPPGLAVTGSSSDGTGALALAGGLLVAGVILAAAAHRRRRQEAAG